MQPDDELRPATGGLTVGIVGSRSFEDRSIIRRAVMNLMERYDWMHVVSGASPGGGADILAREVCRDLGFHMCPEPPVDRLLPCHREGPWHFYERVPAAHNKRAYFARNSEIAADSNMLLAFYAPGPRSPGTTDTVEKAKAKPIPVHIYHEGRWSK